MTTDTAPAGPRGSRLFGNFPQYGRDPLGFTLRLARDYGGVVPIRLGLLPAVIVTDPAVINDVLVARQADFRKSPAVRRLRVAIGDGLLTTEGEVWRRHRRLAQPAFHHERIEAYGEVMVDRTERMLERWHDGLVLDVHAAMMGVTLAIVARTLFAAEVGGDVATVGRAGRELGRFFESRYGSLLFFLPDFVPTPGNIRMHAAIRSLDRIIYRIIGERRASGEDRGDLLSMLLAVRDEEGRPLGDGQLRDEVMTLFLAGHETTALALSWAWYLLADAPEADARLAGELGAVLGGRPPRTADLPALPYAEAVILESLRLYPPAYAVGREAIRDTVVGGHRLRKGTIALLSQWAAHRNPEHFPEPDAFRPERWLDALARRLPRGVYFPFGEGSRKCIGASFAMQEAVLLLATIAQRYSLRLVPGAVVDPQPAVTLRPRAGIRMEALARQDTGVGSGVNRKPEITTSTGRPSVGAAPR